MTFRSRMHFSVTDCPALGLLEGLTLFVKRARELSQRRLMTSGSQWRFYLNRNQIGGPDEEDVRSFLVTFRQFISQSDPIFIGKIFNDCINHLPIGEMKASFQQTKGDWERALRKGDRAFKIDKGIVTPEHALDLWINGCYFHNDPNKAAEFKRLSNRSPALFALSFILPLRDLSAIIIHAADLIERGLQQNLFTLTQKEKQNAGS